MGESVEEKLRELALLREQSRLGGGEEAIAKQHEKGKLTARERISLLMDEGSFNEVDAFVKSVSSNVLGDGVITGFGTIDGRRVCIAAQDFTVMGGSLSFKHSAKICKMMDLAMKIGVPIVALNDSGGARIQEGVVSLAGYAELFFRNTIASGVIPQIAAILGPCAGGAVYSPALMDFVFMVRNTSFMFLTGPDVIKTVLNEEVSFEELGGALTHNQTSGVAHFCSDNEIESLLSIRKLLSYLPSNNLADPPYVEPSDEPNRMEEALRDIVPDEPNKPYDIKEVIELVVDRDSFYEVHSLYATNIVVGFARLNGNVIGIVANQPKELAGTLDIAASLKGSRFIRFCDAFNIPLVTFQDVPGFLPGTNQEYMGIIKHGAKLLYAYCEATVPKLCVITRKSYGGAYCVMSSRQIRSDANFAWPSAELAVMGPQGAVNIIYRKEIASSKDPEKTRKKLVDEYTKKYSNPFIAAEEGYIDEVIDPRETRPKLIAAIELLKGKNELRPKKKHGNIPL